MEKKVQTLSLHTPDIHLIAKKTLSEQKYQDNHKLYNNQINARALIGQSAVVYCASKPTEKLRVF